MNRRGLLKRIGGGMVCLAVPAPVLTAPSDPLKWATVVSWYDCPLDFWWVRISCILSDGREWNGMIPIAGHRAETESQALQIAGRTCARLLRGANR